jgi:uncharacterized SAM-binding protein YcdF (DUF218 family)
VAAAAVLASLRLFVWPSTASPDRADAVVVLSGDRGERLRRGVQLVEAGVAPTLVMAGDPDFPRAAEVCSQPQPFEVVCLRPDPDSTRTEAQATAGLARSRSWERMVVVTAPWHVARVRAVFGGCFPGSMEIVGVQAPGYGVTPRIVAHEWLGIGQALLVGC